MYSPTDQGRARRRARSVGLCFGESDTIWGLGHRGTSPQRIIILYSNLILTGILSGVCWARPGQARKAVANLDPTPTSDTHK